MSSEQALPKISLNLSGVSLKEALKAIEQQTDYKFMYNNSIVNLEKKISINCAAKDLAAVLDMLFAENGISYKIVDNQIVLATASSNAFASVKVNKAVTAADNADVTVLATSKPSLAFHKNAFGFVTRPLEKAVGAESYVTNFDGITLRVTVDYNINNKTQTMSIVYGYDMNTKTDTVSIDMLCGVKTLDANLAAVIDDVR